MRVRCVVAYDGTDFAGWQRQACRRTVQTCLEAGFAAVAGEAVRVTGAGRTDAGVHARGQVAHFDTLWDKPLSEQERAWNAVLPDDVAVSGLFAVPLSFHARVSAVARTYRYALEMHGVRCPLLRRTTVPAPRGTDLALVAEAAGRLLGRRDFGGFGRPMTPEGSTVRTLHRALVRAEGEHAFVEFEADAYLRHQVRRMVGLLLDVGCGRLPVSSVDEVLARRPDAPTARRAPARALTLWAVRYPPEDGPWPGPWAADKGAIREDIHA